MSELERDGPYNTRLNRGLPPTPIGNPGLASLRAAVKPADKSYLFYVRKPGKSGEHAFSSTDAQFERDVKRYQRALATTNGGQGCPVSADASSACAAGRSRTRARRRCTTPRWPRSGSDWRYLLLPLPPHLFAETVRALPAAGFRGVNVTIPHKEAALALADEATETARGDRRREHADLRGRPDPGREHRRARAAGGAGARVRPGRPARARARRRRLGPRGGLGAAAGRRRR